jgi:site-specific DNA-methyltransferase (adenine-specific)
MVNAVLFSKKSDEWETPLWLFNLLDQEFHFTVDIAATIDNKRTHAFYDDFLSDMHFLLWTDIAFCNPPYSKIAAFMKKAYEQSQKGAVVVCLIPCRTDTSYWHDYVMKAQEIRFIKRRLKFWGGKNSAPFPSCVVIFDKRPDPLRLLKEMLPIRIGKTIEQPNKQ